VKKILITGPESSGKSHLAQSLAAIYKVVWVREFAREYLNNKEGYTESDLMKIALGQKRAEEIVWAQNPKYAFSDTGIEVIQIWSEVKYGRVDPQINKLLKLGTYDLILLCKPNIPWQYDKLREHPVLRNELFQMYVDRLIEHQVDFEIVDAPLEERLNQANKWIKEL